MKPNSKTIASRYILLLLACLAISVVTAPVRAEGAEPTPIPLGTEGAATTTPAAAATSTSAPEDTATPTPTPTPTVTPLWPTDTPTPTPTWTPAPNCADLSEPNESPGSGPILAIGEMQSGFTLSPAGDRDFFLMWGKGGTYYRLTSQTSDGVDTRLRVYDPNGAMIAENDDYETGNPAGETKFRAPGDGWFAVAVDSPVNMDWGCRQYQLTLLDVAAPTAEPTATRKPTSPPVPTTPPTAVPSGLTPDDYEPNYDFSTAANIGVGISAALNFNPWPAGAGGVDNDFFRLYVKQGQKLRLETNGLAVGLDTNLILYRENGEVIAGNDDCQTGELRSCLEWAPDMTGLVYVLAGPAGTIPEAVSTDARAYTLSVKDVVNEQPTASASLGASGSSYTRGTPATSRVGQTVVGGSSSPAAWRVTPLPFPTRRLPTATPTAKPMPATPTPRIQVRAIALSPPTPTPRPPQSITLELNVYQDQNNNRAQDMNEAVQGISVRVTDAQTNQLLTYALTDAYGHVALTVAAPGKVRLSVPFLAYSREVGPPGDALTIRLESLRLPSIIP